MGLSSWPRVGEQSVTDPGVGSENTGPTRVSPGQRAADPGSAGCPVSLTDPAVPAAAPLLSGLPVSGSGGRGR